MTEELIDWMKAKNVAPEALAERMGINVKTIYNWRTLGVPPRKIPHLRQIMSEWDSRPGAKLAGMLIQPTPEEFRAWNQAALDAGQLIEDWAIEGLNRLAEEAAPPMLRVAEEPPSYRAKRKGE